MFKNQKGQGSLEYLLLIGGAVLVAAIVIGLVVTSSQNTGGTITDTTQGNANCVSKTAYASCISTAGCIPVDRDGAQISTAANFSRCAYAGGTVITPPGGSCSPDGSTGTCSTGLLGACSAGTRTCTAGVWGTCFQTNPTQAEAGRCSDGIDNDCDGFTDSSDSDCATPTCSGSPGVCSCSSQFPGYTGTYPQQCSGTNWTCAVSPRPSSCVVQSSGS